MLDLRQILNSKKKSDSRHMLRLDRSLLIPVILGMAAILIGAVLIPGSVEAGDQIGGTLTFEGRMEKSADQPEVWANLNLEFQDQSWTGGYQVDFDLKSSLLELAEIELSLNEAYYDYYGENFDLRVGKQIIPWGTALKINPTDNLNPPLPEDPFGDKQPILMAGGNYYFSGGYRLTGVIIPYHQPVREKLILPGGTALTAVPVERDFANRELAVKLSAKGTGNYDYSFSLFKGHEDAPQVRMIEGPTGPRPEAFFREYLVLGADFATSINGVGLWAEGAWQIPEPGEEYYSLVLGADYKLSSDLYLEGQGIYLKDQWGYEDTLIQGALEKPFAEIHNTRLGLMVNPDGGNFLLLPEVEFSLSEAATLSLKYQYFSGQVFSNSEKNALLGGERTEVSLNYFF